MVRAEWPLFHSSDQLDDMKDLSFKIRLLKEKVKSWTKRETQKMKEKSSYLEDEIRSLLNLTQSAILNNE